MLFTAGPALAQQEPPYADEISLFAKMMAIAKTVKESCPGFTADDSFLEEVRQRLQVEKADYQAFAPEARAAAEVLERARDAAPNRQAWCGAAFRLYGPDGKLIRGLLRRLP